MFFISCFLSCCKRFYGKLVDGLCSLHFTHIDVFGLSGFKEFTLKFQIKKHLKTFDQSLQ